MNDAITELIFFLETSIMKTKDPIEAVELQNLLEAARTIQQHRKQNCRI